MRIKLFYFSNSSAKIVKIDSIRELIWFMYISMKMKNKLPLKTTNQKQKSIEDFDAFTTYMFVI